jgi:2-amino-4-hydroxy-6-hydroxymethyldihydropteridine diphosphokinase
MARAVIALGANLGDARAALSGAVAALQHAPGISVIAESSVYVTAPLGGVDQPDYLNAVVLAETSLSPRELLDRLHGIESRWHRTREVRWGPRTLDLDLIEFEGVLSDDPTLTLPHPRAHERAFVLVPWLEVDPEANVSGIGPAAGLVPGLGDQGITIAPKS